MSGDARKRVASHAGSIEFTKQARQISIGYRTRGSICRRTGGRQRRASRHSHHECHRCPGANCVTSDRDCAFPFLTIHFATLFLQQRNYRDLAISDRPVPFVFRGSQSACFGETRKDASPANFDTHVIACFVSLRFRHERNSRVVIRYEAKGQSSSGGRRIFDEYFRMST